MKGAVQQSKSKLCGMSSQVNEVIHVNLWNRLENDGFPQRDLKGFFCLIVVPICDCIGLGDITAQCCAHGSLKLYPDTLFGEQSVVVANSEISKSSRIRAD